MFSGLIRTSTNLLSRLQPLANQQRTLSSLWPRLKLNPVIPWTQNSRFLAPPATPLALQTEGYKVRVRLKKRCPQCYFKVRQNRLYIECTVKPRHKQMQKMSKRKLFRED